jgi:hypothetical protein
MEYMADRSELYIISSDTDSAKSGSASINLHVLGIKDKKIINDEIIPTGFDIEKWHETSIYAIGNDIFINDTMGSGDKTFKRTYKVENGKLVQTSSEDGVARGTVESLEKAVNKQLDGDDIVIEQVQLF